MDFSFKEEEEEVSTTEREEKEGEKRNEEKNDWLKSQSSLFSSLKMKRVGFFFCGATTEMDGAFSFDMVCEFRHPQMLFRHRRQEKKLPFHRDMKERKRENRKRNPNIDAIPVGFPVTR